MKIALYGNMCNNFYAIAKVVRQYSDIDIHLYLADNVDIQQLPESDDPELLNNYPFWIHKSKSWRLKNIIFFWRENIIKEFSKYDIVILSDLGVSLSPFIKAKTIFFVTGGDLTVTPFAEINQSFFKKSISTWFKTRFYQIIQRRGIRNINEIWTQPFYPFVDALKKLKIPKERIKDVYFPLLLDTKLFSYDAAAKLKDNKHIKEITSKYKFFIFHPSRLMIRQDKHTMATGHWKKNDLLIEGFGLFLKKYHVKDAGLVMIDRKFSMDVQQAKELISKLDIEDNIHWLKSPNWEGFKRNELIQFYSAADVVADDFGAGWFGSIVLEGLSIGKPVINFLDEEVMKILYPWHPVFSVNSAEGIADVLYKLYSDSDFKREAGIKSRKWIEEFHSAENASKIYLNNIKSIS